MEVPNPAYSEQDMRAALKAGRPYRIKRDMWIEKGSEISDPEAWKLVMVGVAEPVDQECILACGNINDDELAKRILNYEKVDRGITTGKARLDGSGEPGKRIPSGLDLGTAGIEVTPPSDDEDE